MVEQIRLVEVFQNNPRTVFGFGSHPMATPEQEHAVTTARADVNKLRIIMDELLRGNNLEEIACRGLVDDDAFAKVPVGATPDDIARCSASQDVLPSRCPASNPRSVCICQNEAGCPVRVNGMDTIVGNGAPVGVLDEDEDGASDNTQFIQDAVRIVCADKDVPLDLDLSYWNPSGDQQMPAMGGFDALGPAIVLQTRGALPTNAGCTLAFSPDVVDKDGNQVCAPVDGDVSNGCEPGDTSAIKFTTEELRYVLATTIPATGAKLMDDIKIQANVPLDAASLANIVVTEADAPSANVMVTLGTGAMANVITFHWTGGLTPSTVYKITVPTTVTDAFLQPATAPFERTFTSAAM